MLTQALRYRGIRIALLTEPATGHNNTPFLPELPVERVIGIVGRNRKPSNIPMGIYEKGIPFYMSR